MSNLISRQPPPHHGRTNSTAIQPMTDTYRALCAELVRCWDAFIELKSHTCWDDPPSTDSVDDAVEKIRTALAQPEAEGPTDEDLLGLDELRDAWNAQADASNSWDELGMDEIIWFAQQQALARWGRPAPAPIPVAERLPREEEDGHWCWAGMEVDDVWEWTQLSTFRFGSLHQSYTHWLPHWALPLPAGTETA